MAHRKCTICGKDVVLTPSAKIRSERDKSGRSAQDYLDLFPTHGACAVAKRSQESRDTMARIRDRADQHFVNFETRLRHARAH